MLPKASHRNAATLPGKTGILSCHTGKRAHRHRQKTGPDPPLVALSRMTAVFSRDPLSGWQSFQTGLFCRENTGRKMSLSAGCRRFGQRNKRFHLSKPAIFARRTKLPAGMTPRLRRWIFRPHSGTTAFPVSKQTRTDRRTTIMGTESGDLTGFRRALH